MKKLQKVMEQECMRKHKRSLGPTHYFYLLATVNPIGETLKDVNTEFQVALSDSPKDTPPTEKEMASHAYKFRKMCLPKMSQRDLTRGLTVDEGLLDLAHMRGWCPTSAYATESALKLARLLNSTSPDADEP
jgi:hypothetical protein